VDKTHPLGRNRDFRFGGARLLVGRKENFMEMLVGYSVEGLRRQGWREVWVTLGTYENRAAADSAQAGPLPVDVVQTRVLPYYRVTPPLAGLAPRRLAAMELDLCS